MSNPAFSQRQGLGSLYAANADGRGTPDDGESMLLTRTEEIALAARVQAGRQADATRETVRDSLAARDILVLKNLGLIGSVTRRYPWHNKDDMDQAGALGLLTAAQRFDPTSRPGARFATYAMYWIQLRVVECIRRVQLVSIPNYQWADSDPADRTPRKYRAHVAQACAPHRYLARGRKPRPTDWNEEHDSHREPEPAAPANPETEEERSDRAAALAAALALLSPTLRHHHLAVRLARGVPTLHPQGHRAATRLHKRAHPPTRDRSA